MGKKRKPLPFDPGEFRGMTLIDHCRADLERNKEGSTVGLTKKELASRFLNVGGQQTTSDFAVALEEALNKLLLRVTELDIASVHTP